ncbi:carbohydrate ABC transporter permease [Pseudotabrizicola alkalilacus]|uniref:Sugar ABC transporter permease n=1 Tax=Pseudotabrizicola alkalilacus TaxID=2305252 RepID=A0A411YWZ6_9RHOB|nr:sugar ABC transporter permease [Pseudotabrizicola alkalilacus]RGP35255.1 sugar ABC transporter permease [Pseudotabrizicola alkalilacus]
MPARLTDLLLYTAPFLIVTAVFVFYPLVANIWYSFYSFSAFDPVMRPAGLGNYQRLVTDPAIVTALVNVSLYAVLSVMFQVGLGLVLAAILSQAFLGFWAKLFRTLFFIPVVMSITVIAFVFTFFYDPFSGLLNMALQAVGLGHWARAWLGESATAIYAVIAVSQWQSVGYVMMLFIVAIQSIPRDLYEAAELDGAGAVAQFFHITVPQVREMLIVATVVTVTGSITVFSEPYIMTGGGPGDSSATLATYMYRSAFFRDEMGYAAAIAALIFVATMVVSLLQLRVFGKAK